MNIYFAEPVITTELVHAIQASIWVQATAMPDNDWHVFVTQYEANATPGVEEGLIDSLEVGYAVIQPIPYRIERVGDGNYEASFREANISVGGVDEQDAYQSLVAEILDTFDALAAEPALAPDAEAQLRALREYIVKT